MRNTNISKMGERGIQKKKKKKKPGWENPKRKQEYQKSVTCLTTAKSRDKFGKERLAN